MIQALCHAGECWPTSALLPQLAGVVQVVPHNSARHAAQLFRMVANDMRLRHRRLLSAYQSARESVEVDAASSSPNDVCGHLLCLADVHLEALDPLGALGPCLRCLSSAENSRLTHVRTEALVRLAKVRLEMGDAAQALQILEGVAPSLCSASAMLRGSAAAAQAEALLELA